MFSLLKVKDSISPLILISKPKCLISSQSHKTYKFRSEILHMFKILDLDIKVFIIVQYDNAIYIYISVTR